jgi:hypothetical protein
LRYRVELGFEKHNDLLPSPPKVKRLTEADGGDTPTCDTESNSGFETHEDLLPFPLYPLGERVGVRG